MELKVSLVCLTLGDGALKEQPKILSPAINSQDWFVFSPLHTGRLNRYQA